MKFALAVTVVPIAILLGGCQTAPTGHQPSPIPFDIDHLTAAQNRVLRAVNATDRTPYLEKSRPIYFQIVQARNNADEARNAGPNREPVDVLIYALGEADGDRLVDYGWIERADTGAKVWSMADVKTEPAGGDARNRKVFARFRLEPGQYRLRFVSNDSHAYPDWTVAPPERPRHYGIAVYNRTALPRIEAALRKACVPGLAASLR